MPKRKDAAAEGRPRCVADFLDGRDFSVLPQIVRPGHGPAGASTMAPSFSISSARPAIGPRAPEEMRFAVDRLIGKEVAKGEPQRALSQIQFSNTGAEKRSKGIPA